MILLEFPYDFCPNSANEMQQNEQYPNIGAWSMDALPQKCQENQWISLSDVCGVHWFNAFLTTLSLKQLCANILRRSPKGLNTNAVVYCHWLICVLYLLHLFGIVRLSNSLNRWINCLNWLLILFSANELHFQVLIAYPVVNCIASPTNWRYRQERVRLKICLGELNLFPCPYIHLHIHFGPRFALTWPWFGSDIVNMLKKPAQVPSIPRKEINGIFLKSTQQCEPRRSTRKKPMVDPEENAGTPQCKSHGMQYFPAPDAKRNNSAPPNPSGDFGRRPLRGRPRKSPEAFWGARAFPSGFGALWIAFSFGILMGFFA